MSSVQVYDQKLAFCHMVQGQGEINQDVCIPPFKVTLSLVISQIQWMNFFLVLQHRNRFQINLLFHAMQYNIIQPLFPIEMIQNPCLSNTKYSFAFAINNQQYCQVYWNWSGIIEVSYKLPLLGWLCATSFCTCWSKFPILMERIFTKSGNSEDW